MGDKVRGSAQRMGDTVKQGAERLDNTMNEEVERMDQSSVTRVEGIPETMKQGVAESMNDRRRSIDPGASTLWDDTNSGSAFGQAMGDKVRDTAKEMSSTMKSGGEQMGNNLQRGGQAVKERTEQMADRMTQSVSDSSHQVQSAMPDTSAYQNDSFDVRPGMQTDLPNVNTSANSTTAGGVKELMTQVKDTVMQAAQNMEEKVKEMVSSDSSSKRNVQPGTPPLVGTNDNFDNDPGISIDQIGDQMREAKDAVKQTAHDVKEKVREVITGERSKEKPDETKSEVRTRKADYKPPRVDEEKKKRGSSSE
jgi:hypothetical protein